MLTGVSETLVCPFGTEEDPVLDLSKLPCGHYVSAKAWANYRLAQPEKVLRCPSCTAVTEQIGVPLPMAEIGDALKRIENDLKRLRGYLISDCPVLPPTQQRDREIQEPREPMLIDLEEDIDDSHGTHEQRPMINGHTTNLHDGLLDEQSDYLTELSEGLNSAPSPSHTPPSQIFTQSTTQTSDPFAGPRTKTLPLTPIIIPPTDVAGRSSPSRRRSSLHGQLTAERNSSIDSQIYSSNTSRSSVSEEILKSPTSTVRSSFDQSFIKSFRLRANINVQIRQRLRESCRATAISPSCQRFVFVNEASFTIFSMPKVGTNCEDLCCGFADGRFGDRPESASNDGNDVQPPIGVSLIYTRAALTDSILCLACTESYLDIRSAESGQRIDLIKLPDPCRNILVSPDGEMLVIGMDTGELKVHFFRVARSDLSLIPKATTNRLINCLAFSPDSHFLAVCTSDNVIRIYELDLQGFTAKVVSRYDRGLAEKDCRPNHYGVTGLALYIPISFVQLMQLVQLMAYLCL